MSVCSTVGCDCVGLLLAVNILYPYICNIFVNECVFKLRPFEKIDCVSSGSCLLS